MYVILRQASEEEEKAICVGDTVEILYKVSILAERHPFIASISPFNACTPVTNQDVWYRGEVIASPVDDFEGLGRWQVQCDVDKPGLITCEYFLARLPRAWLWCQFRSVAQLKNRLAAPR